MASKNKKVKKTTKTAKKKVLTKASKTVYKQRGQSNEDYDERFAALPPGWRKSKVTSKKYFENRKNRSDMPGSLTGFDAKDIFERRNDIEKILISYSIYLRNLKKRKAPISEIKKYEKIVKGLKDALNSYQSVIKNISGL